MVIFSECKTKNAGLIGVVKLCSPGTLNVLTFDMVAQMKAQLEKWNRNDNILFILIHGQGKSFCAGGDVVRLRHSSREKDRYRERFFSTEYGLDYLLHTYSKPVLCFAQGYVLGGGVGIFMAASHKITTLTTRCAMPEVKIGFYPDVGASWFLGRIRNNLGLFIGFSGCEMLSGDMDFLAISDYVVDLHKGEDLLEMMTDRDWSADRLVLEKELLTLLSTQQIDKSLVPASQISMYCQEIDGALERADSAAALYQNLQAISVNNEFFASVKKNLEYASPFSLSMVFQQHTFGTRLSLEDVFRFEFFLSMHFSLERDFDEGVRALLVDKDKSPKWQFPDLESVPDTYISEFLYRVEKDAGIFFN
ncbi:MAG: enoyl-CoA hydratase/isomerase family protein [Pseudomonadales bacterium]|nr:enoyl-CoA hydratase/isomerase family protein [Pseudomonadales bacterium]